MIKRFMELQIYLEMLVVRNIINRSEMLTSKELNELSQIEKVLFPFMAAQKALEGEKYVSNSLIPHVVGEMRRNMKETIRDSTDGEVVYMVNKLLDDPTNGFNNYWGKGETNTVFRENETLGNMQRQKGIPKKTLLAYFLDPRTKDLLALGNDDIAELLEYTKVEVLKVARETEVPAVAANLVVAIASLDDNEEEDEDEIYGGLFSKMRKPETGMNVRSGQDDVLIQRVNMEISTYRDSIL